MRGDGRVGNVRGVNTGRGGDGMGEDMRWEEMVGKGGEGCRWERVR